MTVFMTDYGGGMLCNLLSSGKCRSVPSDPPLHPTPVQTVFPHTPRSPLHRRIGRDVLSPTPQFSATHPGRSKRQT